MCVHVSVGVSDSACQDQRGRRQSREEKFAEFMRRVGWFFFFFFCMKERFEGKVVSLEAAAAAAATDVCGGVAVMFQSETEVTSLRGQDLLHRIVLR